MQSRIYRWRDIGGILRSFILYSRTKEAGSCCRWQHLVKGRKGGREERRRFFGDFETKRESGTRRGGKGKREKEVSWRGREEKARRRRGYRRLQTLHGSPPSHNNTTPSPLAATQLLPPVEVLPAIHAFTARFHARFHQPYPHPRPTIFSPAARPTTHYENPIQGETHLFLLLPPSSPPFSSFSDLPAPHIFSPSFIPPSLFLPPAFSPSLLISLLVSRPRFYFSLSLSRFRFFPLAIFVVAVVIVAVAGRTKPPPLDATAEINEKHTSK